MIAHPDICRHGGFAAHVGGRPADEGGMEEQAGERRLGKRHVLGPVAVRWKLDGMAVDPRRGWGEPEKAGLLDLSVSGCRIMARTSDDLAVGDWTTVAIRGRSGPVVVRRIEPASHEGFSTYALEFLDPMSPLTQLVHEALARKADPTRFDPEPPVPRRG